MNAVRKRQSVDPPKRAHLEDLLDQALDQSFPASDPIAIDFEAPRNEDTTEEGSK